MTERSNDPNEYKVLDAVERHALGRLSGGAIAGCNRNTSPVMALIYQGLAFDGGFRITITPRGLEVLERVS